MQEKVEQFAIWSPEVRANPHPLYARMRAEAPVYPAIGPNTGSRFWFLTRYDDCVAALKDNEHFANDLTTIHGCGRWCIRPLHRASSKACNR